MTFFLLEAVVSGANPVQLVLGGIITALLGFIRWILGHQYEADKERRGRDDRAIEALTKATGVMEQTLNFLDKHGPKRKR